MMPFTNDSGPHSTAPVPVLWRKSSRSQGAGGNCVETASLVDGRVAVRDSKRPDDAVLVFSSEAWRSFVDGTKAGAFDL